MQPSSVSPAPDLSFGGPSFAHCLFVQKSNERMEAVIGVSDPIKKCLSQLHRRQLTVLK
jgi:hypothetical protein